MVELRIIYLHQYFRTPQMAGGTRSFEMARRFVQAGHEVHIVTSKQESAGSGPFWTTTVEQGVVVHWCNVPYSNRMGYLRRIWSFVAYAVSAAVKASILRGDVIYATSTPLTIAFPAVFASRLNRIPMVFEVRDLWPKVPIALGVLRGIPAVAARLLEQFAYRNASSIIALSPGMASGIEEAGYPIEGIHVIPNAADLEMFAPGEVLGGTFRSGHNWLQDRPLVVYTGTIGAVNGLRYFVRLAAEVARLDPEIRFLVVGDGREGEVVRQEAERLGVLSRTFFMLGPVPKARVPEILAAATLVTSFVIPVPALWDNSANKFFDGLAAGRPVAINYGGWQAELIRTHGVGLVLDATDISAAGKSLLEVVRDEAWLVQAGNAARALAERKFSRDKLAQQVLDVLKTTAATKS